MKQEEASGINTINDGIKLGELWIAFIDFKRLILYFSLVTTIAAFLYSMTITPTYKATTLIVAADQKNGMGSLSSGLGGLASLAGIQVDQGADPLSTSIAIFKSRKFIEQYIKDENLLPLLFNELWHSKENDWKDNDIPSISSGYSRYKAVMTIVPIGDLYTVSFEMIDPKIAAQLSSGSVIRLNNYIRNQTIEETQRSILFLEQEITQTNVTNAQQFLFSLIEEQTKNKMLASVREEYVFKIIDPAVVPTGIFRPNINQIVLIGLLLGLAFSYMMAILVNIFGLKIPYLKEISSIKGL